MAWARQNGRIVLTHDLDFGALLAATLTPCCPRQRWGIPASESFRAAGPLTTALIATFVVVLHLWTGTVRVTHRVPR
jgi:hypothetical protein